MVRTLSIKINAMLKHLTFCNEKFIVPETAVGCDVARQRCDILDRQSLVAEQKDMKTIWASMKRAVGNYQR
jgi:hypothetical protein